MELTSRDIEVLGCLIDEIGYPLWWIADRLECDKGNLSRTIKGLESENLVYHTKAKSSKWKPRSPNMLEHRYFICKTYFNLRTLEEHAKRRIIYHDSKITQHGKKVGISAKNGIARHDQILVNKFKVFLEWVAVVKAENPEMRRVYGAVIAPRPRSHQGVLFGPARPDNR